MLGLPSAARTVFRKSDIYNRGFLGPKDSPANSLIHSPNVLEVNRTSEYPVCQSISDNKIRRTLCSTRSTEYQEKDNGC